ncbi:MAG: hypothetical protein QM504_18520 [Pseudomonadota bacterium]
MNIKKILAEIKKLKKNDYINKQGDTIRELLYKLQSEEKKIKKQLKQKIDGKEHKEKKQLLHVIKAQHKKAKKLLKYVH